MDSNQLGNKLKNQLNVVHLNGKERTTTLSSTVSDQTFGSASSADKLIPERDQWDRPIEFVLSCINYAIGLGNVWRYPALVYRNGGGAFLIPYFIMVFIVGLPIFFAELVVGQFCGMGPNKAYARMAPFFSGLGYCTLVVITLVTIYYMVIISWIIFYLIHSFMPVLGWGSCGHDFNTERCYSGLEDLACKQNNTNGETDMIFWRKQCYRVASICTELGLSGANGTTCLNTTTGSIIPINHVINRTLASEEYYNEYVLGLGDASWTNWGYPRWQLVCCLFAAWVIAFFCVVKGIKSVGKVVYFTSIFPYVILTVLLIRGATLPGAIDGIWFYIKPDWDKLWMPGVWADAASQTFYSFGIGCGSLVTLASYNKFSNNSHFDAVAVSITNGFTAVFAGFSIFAILGFMAHSMDVPVSEVVTEGPGLAFIAYPEAVLLMPLPQLWAVLFFIMMFILGIGSQFAGIEAINTAVIDHWPHLRSKQWKVTLGTCLFCFIAALPMVCNGGIYLFTLFDWHTASWAVLLIGFAEIIVISWVYGFDRIIENLWEMGMKFNATLRYYWWTVWMIITPIFSVGIFVFTLTDIGPTNYVIYGEEYPFPLWADTIGWLLGSATLLPFPCFLVYQIIKYRSDWRALFKPTNKWRSQANIHGNSMVDKEASPVEAKEAESDDSSSYYI